MLEITFFFHNYLAMITYNKIPLRCLNKHETLILQLTPPHYFFHQPN